jgi:uncharacterized protein with GYD domain
MPKYLLTASYSAEGLRGLQKDKASGRVRAATAAIEAAGGKVEWFYYAFGEDDVVGIVDYPDNVSAASLSLAVSASGLVRTRTTALMTVDEVDRSRKKHQLPRARPVEA